MKKTYTVTGMTCGGCQKSVTEKLLSIPEVQTADVDLEQGTATIHSDDTIALVNLEAVLPQKYSIKQKQVLASNTSVSKTKETSKLKQLTPLFLIFSYLFGASILLHIKEWSWQAFMLDFMGLFYIVFSFFKLLDLKGFPQSFAMYDPLAKRVPVYGWVYPFLELTLGLFFLFRFEVTIALWVTLIILGTTTVGVIQSLVSKKRIRCACLGTALKLPMTEATLIENILMIAMAIYMLANT